jgi:hypothetical protein
MPTHEKLKVLLHKVFQIGPYTLKYHCYYFPLSKIIRKSKNKNPLILFCKKRTLHFDFIANIRKLAISAKYFRLKGCTLNFLNSNS